MPRLLERNGSNSGLRAPVRNRYFWGKLLDAEHLEMEQRYLNEKRWLLNRLVHGSGVLCGLKIEPTDDGTALWIHPGVAIDGRGREIIVSESFCVGDPTQPTDACGRPAGDPVRSGTVWLCLAYHECEIEPARALVSDCDLHDGCHPSAVRERFRVLVQSGDPPRPPTVIDSVTRRPGGGPAPSAMEALAAPSAGRAAPVVQPAPITGPFADEISALLDARRRICEVWSPRCAPPEQSCVVLAALAVDDNGGIAVEQCTYRRLIPSNADLLDAIVLAANELARLIRESRETTFLRYETGDAQSAAVGTALGKPIAAIASDEAGNPVEDVTVTFRIMGGDGFLGDVGGPAPAATEHTVQSDSAGRAAAVWQVGPQKGLNTAEATIGVGQARIAFHALGT